jgi:hypothetical protein
MAFRAGDEVTAQRDSTTAGAVALGAKQTSHKTNHSPLGANWFRYEVLKSEFTATATTPVEYEAACRRAARIAGV